MRSPGESEDVQADPMTDTVGTAEVGTERRLAVGPGGDQIEPSTSTEDACAEPSHGELLRRLTIHLNKV